MLLLHFRGDSTYVSPQQICFVLFWHSCAPVAVFSRRNAIVHERVRCTVREIQRCRLNSCRGGKPRTRGKDDDVCGEPLDPQKSKDSERERKIMSGQMPYPTVRNPGNARFRAKAKYMERVLQGDSNKVHTGCDHQSPLHPVHSNTRWGGGGLRCSCPSPCAWSS